MRIRVLAVMVAMVLMVVASAQAGVVKFAGKHVVKPVAKRALFPVEHPKRTARGVKKVVF